MIEEERAIRKLMKREKRKAEKKGFGRAIEYAFSEFAKIYEDTPFDGGGVVLDDNCEVVLDYAYTHHDGFFLFTTHKENALSGGFLKPLLKFARKYKYRIFDSEEFGEMSERGKKEIYDYTTETFVPVEEE